MWHGQWQHMCSDGTLHRQSSETKLHPVHGHGMPPRCPYCERGWTLVSWQGPMQQPRKRARSRKKDWSYPGEQLSLFGGI